MRMSVERLRWGLVAGLAALLVIVVGYVAYGRYTALMRWKEILRKSGGHFTHDAKGITWSQSENGKTLFIIHAARAVQKSTNVYELHDADLTLFSRTSPRIDHIYGADFEYDQNTGVARALGEVHMDLQAPEALTEQNAPRAIRGREGRAPSAPTSPKESTQTIHVRTSGLVYVRSLGVAATKEDVEFHYGGIEAHAQGAEFDEGASAVHLLADVRLTGTVHNTPLDVRAAKADLDRSNDLVAMLSPTVASGEKALSAGSATAHLRKDGSVDTVHAAGRVRMARGDEVLTGDTLEASMNTKSSPETASMQGHVEADVARGDQPLHATAQRVDATFSPDGDVRTLKGTGGVVLKAREKTSLGNWLSRSVNAATMDAVLTEAGDLATLHAYGKATAEGEQEFFAAAKKGAKPAFSGKRQTSLAAEDLVASFQTTEDGKITSLQRVIGNGGAKLLQTSPNGARSESETASLVMEFGPGPLGTPLGTTVLKSATETGGVRLRSQAAAQAGKGSAVTTASAVEVAYDGEEDTLRLRGDARFAQGGVQVAAERLLLTQGTGDAKAEGAVTTTFAGDANRPSSHVLSARATFARLGEVATFLGSDTQPARLWQGGSQVTAAKIVMDGALGTLSASPEAAGAHVTAVFPQGAATATSSAKVTDPRKPARASMARSVLLEAHTLQYADKRREAVLTGNVTMRSASGEVRADRAVVFMKPRPAAPAKGAPAPPKIASADPSGGEIERIVASGAVRMDEPGRSGTGEQLVYTASSGEMILTGSDAHPPRVHDADQGSVSGQTLVFGSRDNSVVVSSDAKHGRVHSESEIQP